MRTWNEITAEYAAQGKHHCLKLSCVVCGNTRTCRCSTPKDSYEGICEECEASTKLAWTGDERDLTPKERSLLADLVGDLKKIPHKDWVQKVKEYEEKSGIRFCIQPSSFSRDTSSGGRSHSGHDVYVEGTYPRDHKSIWNEPDDEKRVKYRIASEEVPADRLARYMGAGAYGELVSDYRTRKSYLEEKEHLVGALKHKYSGLKLIGMIKKGPFVAIGRSPEEFGKAAAQALIPVFTFQVAPGSDWESHLPPNFEGCIVDPSKKTNYVEFEKGARKGILNSSDLSITNHEDPSIAELDKWFEQATAKAKETDARRQEEKGQAQQESQEEAQRSHQEVDRKYRDRFPSPEEYEEYKRTVLEGKSSAARIKRIEKDLETMKKFTSPSGIVSWERFMSFINRSAGQEIKDPLKGFFEEDSAFISVESSDISQERLARYMQAGTGRSGPGHVTSDGSTVKVTMGKYKAEFNLKTMAAYLDLDGAEIVAIKPRGGFKMEAGRKTGTSFKFEDGALNEGLVEVMNVSPEQLQQKFDGDTQVSFFVKEATNKSAADLSRIAANLMSVFEDIRKDLDEARSKTTDPKALRDLDAVLHGLNIIEKGIRTTQGKTVMEPKLAARLDAIANEIEPVNPVIALALDWISDKLEGRIAVDLGYSDLKVMRSGAGYYIGRSYREKGSDWDEPGSRESGYYPSESAARKDLLSGDFEVRDATENNSAYEHGDLPDIRREDIKKKEIEKAKKAVS